jgi:hypothetical protein
MAPKEIYYSDKYNDDKFEYRHVMLPKDIAKLVPKTHLVNNHIVLRALFDYEKVKGCSSFITRYLIVESWPKTRYNVHRYHVIWPGLTNSPKPEFLIGLKTMFQFKVLAKLRILNMCLRNMP